jgi:hypothetical protein
LTGLFATPAAAQSRRYKLQDLDVPTIRTQFAEFTRNERNKVRVDPVRAVADLDTPEIEFNKGVPRLNMTFQATTEPPGSVEPVRALVLEFVGQFLVTDDPEYQKLRPSGPDSHIGVFLRPRGGRPPLDVFQPPPGLVTPVHQLLAMRGCWAANCFPFTPANCFDLAGDCYRWGLYYDAVALLDHALFQDRQASYYYLKAMSELQLGRCPEAMASVREMVAARAAGRNEGLSVVMERYNGPLRARIDDLVKFAANR